jgi:hypothetical protein
LLLLCSNIISRRHLVAAISLSCDLPDTIVYLCAQRRIDRGKPKNSQENKTGAQKGNAATKARSGAAITKSLTDKAER